MDVIIHSFGSISHGCRDLLKHIVHQAIWMLYIRSFVRSEMCTLLIMDERTFSWRTVIHWMLGCLSIGKTSLMDNRRASLRGCHSFVRSLLWWDATDYG